MILNLEKIKEITIGAARVLECERGVSFNRFTAEEEAFYFASPLYERTYTTAGIRLEFFTDGDGLNLQLHVKKADARDFFACDVLVNRRLAGCIKNFSNFSYEENFPDGAFSGRFALGEGRKMVSVLLPWSVSAAITLIEIENATYVERAPRQKTMLIYGDSITHGYDAENPSNTYSLRLADALDAAAYNKAIGSAVFTPGIAQIKNDLAPDYITVAYGTNDWNDMSKEEFFYACDGFLGALCDNYPGAKIFVITPIWRGNIDIPQPLGEFSELIDAMREICGRYSSVIMIDGIDLVPHDAKYFADGWLHPNDNGFERHFTNLLQEIKKYI